MPNAPDRPTVQLSDGPGRMSRALPLLLAEQAHLGTAAHGTALIPIVEGSGFALFGAPYEDGDVCRMAGAAAQVAGLVVDAREEPWTITFRHLRVEDAAVLASGEVRASPGDPWPAAKEIAGRLLNVAAPAWYDAPDADYLLRLEQNLAVMTERFVPGFRVSGEHEILDGALQLCARLPQNALVRLLFAQTLREMKRIRPELPAEYAARVGRLQQEHPIGGVPGELVGKALAEAFAAKS